MVQNRISERILRHADENYHGRYRRLALRFKGAFCYVDAYLDASHSEQHESPNDDVHGEALTHLCRLRYHGNEDRWSFAFFAYSSMKYETSVLNNGSFYGTPEEAFDTSAVYLDD